MSSGPSRQRAAELSAALTLYNQLKIQCLRGGVARQCAYKNPANIAHVVLQLQRIATSQKTAATNLCNIPNYQETYNKRTEGQRERVAALLEAFPGAKVKLGGDPRGNCCYLSLPGVAGDAWDIDDNGVRGWPVY